MRCLAFPLLALLVLAGCVDDFDPASLITRNRVLGAKVEVEGNPDAAWVRPGQNAVVRWLVVDEAEPKPMTWAFVACAAGPVNGNMAFCAGDPFALAVHEEAVVGGKPTLGLSVPEEDALEGAPMVFVVGVVCANGVPALSSDPEQSGCRGEEAEETIVTFTIPIAREPAYNAHPQLEDVTLGGEPWTGPPDPLPFVGCTAADDNPGLPHVRADSDELEIVTRVLEGSFDEVPDNDFEVDLERLLLSSFTTAGELEHQFSIVDAEDGSANVAWRLPALADVITGGLLVQFAFVVRDQRGGIDWTRRALCVTR